MSDRASNSTGGGVSQVQIGHYILGETLGIGTFGKVKGKWLSEQNNKLLINE